MSHIYLIFSEQTDPSVSNELSVKATLIEASMMCGFEDREKNLIWGKNIIVNWNPSRNSIHRKTHLSIFNSYSVIQTYFLVNKSVWVHQITFLLKSVKTVYHAWFSKQGQNAVSGAVVENSNSGTNIRIC